jgi:hypothetical protein
VRPMLVVMGAIAGQDMFEMAATKNQHPVETFATDRADEALAERVGPGRPDRTTRVSTPRRSNVEPGKCFSATRRDRLDASEPGESKVFGPEPEMDGPKPPGEYSKGHQWPSHAECRACCSERETRKVLSIENRMNLCRRSVEGGGHVRSPNSSPRTPAPPTSSDCRT